MSKAKRHNWSPGLMHRCRNAGCPWRWRYAVGSGGNPGRPEYSRDGTTWGQHPRVPPCEGER
jgi:hypothetical protein